MMSLQNPAREHSSDWVLLNMAARFKWLCGVLGLCFAVVVGAYWYHQIVRAEHYERLEPEARAMIPLKRVFIPID